MKSENRFYNQINLIDDLGELVAHLLHTVATSNEKALASFVLLLSALPEYYGMMGATGNRVVSAVAACISVVVVKLALRQTPLPAVARIGKPRNAIPVFWLLYAAQIGAGVAFIWAAATYIDIGFIVISAVGAVCSEDFAQLIKAEMRERSQEDASLDFEAEKQRIKLEEMAAKSKARTAAYQQKHGVVEPEQAQSVTDADAQKAVISAEKNAEGRERGRKTQQSNVEKRRDSLLEMLIERYPGVQLEEITYTEMGKMIGKSADTAKRDLLALQSAGRVNGRVPEGI